MADFSTFELRFLKDWLSQYFEPLGGGGGGGSTAYDFGTFSTPVDFTLDMGTY